MKTEKHIIKGHFKGKRPHVKVTAYELSAVDCSADKMSGYYSQETTLISDDPEPGYDFAGWSVTGSNVTGNNVRFEGDITAKANYSAHVYNVALQNDGHGTITANKTTGNLGDTITLSNTPATHYHFSGYSVTGATLTSNQFNIETNDVTAKGWFAEDPKYNLTLQNDGHGSIGAGKTTGYQGDTTTLSNTANNGYVFSAYTVTGATLNGSTIKFGAQDATAKAWFSAVPQSALYYSNKGITNTTSTSPIYTWKLDINCNTTAYRYININFNFYHKHTSTAAGFQICSAYPSKDLIYGYPVKYYTPISFFMSGTGSYSSESSYYGLFYPNTAYAKQSYLGTGRYCIYHKTLDASANPKMKYVIDRNTRNYTAYVNNTNVGHGILSPSGNVDKITNFVITSYASVSQTGIISGTNIRIAGFANFNDATAYNG